MKVDEELRLAVRPEVEAVRMHERSRTATWLGAAILHRFRAFSAEETAAALRRGLARG